ncbi:Uu.00g122550.m01.CDS01 [Anthostomella pinea]|uniref:Uu.00g122550.m01.CDS01 n=1 Tax=Anthostomella pinea TaxID=933095 RepID=A0AAI8YHF6_9PEZI|nr:Uu.00g122550.m01.CDS01 [Anthostomella pinea]
MASNPYEVEHNIQAPTSQPHRRRPDMSSFTSHLHQISQDASQPHRAGPTPVDTAALYRLVQDQLATLRNDAPDAENQRFLEQLMGVLEGDIAAPPDHVPGVTQEYLDTLERVPRKALEVDDSCPICRGKYLDDKYCLVVELPCHGRHRYDLECAGPWLLSKGNCPMCRMDLTKKRVVEVPKDDEEDEQDDVDGLYG